ncbi:hypothetical protein GOV11_01515 [Candidatus Woesearchaeota archaeon]|nr:hypothetical protein [Candidatus Woesearchaeota archaeon]
MVRGEGIGLLASRRGMSPLIATILLMAFAVALGGMIMNWSIDISINNECEQIEVSISQFCIEGDNINLRGRVLDDSVNLQGVKLLIVTGQAESLVNIKDSATDAGEDISLKIPVLVADGSRVDLIGVVGSKQNPVACEEFPMERADPISPC